MTPAVHIFEETVAPSGLAIYAGRSSRTGAAISSTEDLSQGLVRVRIGTGKVVEQETIRIGRRIRDVKVARDGAVWLITEHRDGEVLRLTPVTRAARD